MQSVTGETDVALARRTSAVISAILLFCLLATGCSHSGGFIDETFATDLRGCFVGSAEPTPAPEKGDSATAPVLSPLTYLSDDSDHADPAAPWLAPASPTAKAETPRIVWGILDLRGFPVDDQVASNGVEFKPLFLLDIDFNIMLWREQRLYLFVDSSFWGQKAAPGITNPSQGAFDFSKREYDFNLGAAWNYSGPWEARLFAYSFNNLNRGNSQASPSGFNDGVGLENRYYLGDTYAHLGTTEFDAARATFLSVGYYPTKSMVDGNGNPFKPGLFARAYLTQDLWSELFYLYADVQFIASRSFQPTLLNLDAGVAARPFIKVPRLEFRAGTQDMIDLQGGDMEAGVYLAIRYVY